MNPSATMLVNFLPPLPKGSVWPLLDQHLPAVAQVAKALVPKR